MALGLATGPSTQSEHPVPGVLLQILRRGAARHGSRRHPMCLSRAANSREHERRHAGPLARPNPLGAGADSNRTRVRTTTAVRSFALPNGTTVRSVHHQRPGAAAVCSICQANRAGAVDRRVSGPRTRLAFGACGIWRYQSGRRPGIDRHAHSGWLPGPRAPPVSRYADMWGRVKPLLVSAQASVGVVFDADRDLRRAQCPCRLPPRRGVQ